MRRLWRLLLYVRPYLLYSLASVVLLAVVGAMAAFRVLLVKPIFDNVLAPDAPSRDVLVFKGAAPAACAESAFSGSESLS